MARKELIQAQAKDHKIRGLYDNAACRSGLERTLYAETWESTKC